MTSSMPTATRVKKSLLKLADKMVKYGIAKSRSHAFNIMIRKGLDEALRTVKEYEKIYKELEKLSREQPEIRHGDLNRILEEDRSVRS